MLPNIEIGLMQSGRQRRSIEISSSIFVIPTDNTAEAVKYKSEIREQISFYVSTPPYRPVFDLEGWGDVADELKALAKLFSPPNGITWLYSIMRSSRLPRRPIL